MKHALASLSVFIFFLGVSAEAKLQSLSKKQEAEMGKLFWEMTLKIQEASKKGASLSCAQMEALPIAGPGLSDAYEKLSQYIEPQYQMEAGMMSVIKTLSDTTAACITHDQQKLLIADPPEVTKESDALYERRLKEIRNDKIELLGKALEVMVGAPEMGSVARYLAVGYDNGENWCAYYANVITKFIDCYFFKKVYPKFSSPKMRELPPEEELKSPHRSWIWYAMPEGDLGWARNYANNYPGNRSSSLSDCKAGSFAVWGQSGKGHVTMVIGENRDGDGNYQSISTIGGNESGGQVDKKSGAGWLGVDLSSKKQWNGCVPIWPDWK